MDQDQQAAPPPPGPPLGEQLRIDERTILVLGQVLDMRTRQPDVANALGAVVGQVRVTAEIRVSQPREGLFRFSTADGVHDFTQDAPAVAAAETAMRTLAAGRAREAGSDDAEIEVSTEYRVSTVEGQRMFVEAHVVATASGRPRIAVRGEGGPS